METTSNAGPDAGDVLALDAVVAAVEVDCYRIPTDAPEADGTLSWQATEMVVVHLQAGGPKGLETGSEKRPEKRQVKGLGFSFTAARPAAALIKHQLQDCLIGKSVFDIPARWTEMNHRLRNAGRPGLGLMAIAALDQALWDLKAKLLQLPLPALLGQAQPSVRAYGSGGFTTYSDAQLTHQLERWLGQGFRSVKIKIGADAAQTEHAIALARQVIGPDIQLMVDLNGACQQSDALALAHRLAPYNLCWLEEPVSSDDLAGLHWLRNRVPAGTAIAAGEYGWDSIYFRRMLEAQAVDVLQADATRCGYTGFLQAAALCQAYGVPLSAHCAPAVHAPLCVAVPEFRHCEYFHDHARVEALILDTGTSLRDGQLWPDLTRPGHGIELRRSDAERYRL